MKLIKAALNVIQCHLRRSLSQGINTGSSSMNTRMFAEDCLSVQERNCNTIEQENVGLVRKEEGAGAGRHLRKPRLCAGTKNYSRHRGQIVVGVYQLDLSFQTCHLSATRKFKFPKSEVNKEEPEAKGQ